jgi:EAL domain-containing protein (putative c-di-GMP-specific phosphodiesterase class I)
VQLSGVARVVDVLQIALAGMVVPVAAGELAGWWRGDEEDPARRPRAALLLVAGAVLASNAIVVDAVPGHLADAALLVRAIALSLLAVVVLPVASRVSARRAPVALTVLVAAIAAARIVLWVSGDLVYAHRYGAPVYGPLLPVLNGAVLVLALGFLVYAGLHRRKPTEQVAVVAGVTGSLLVAVLSMAVPSRSWAELLTGYTIVPVVASLYVIVVSRLARLRGLERSFAQRQASLAELWRDALTLPLDALADHGAVTVQRGLAAERSSVAFGRRSQRAAPTRDSQELSVAIEGPDGVIGSVTASRRQPFDPVDTHFLTAVAHVMAAGQERQRMNELFRDEVMHDEVMAQALRAAVERGDIVAHYQPIFDLSSGRMTRVEALARWQRGVELRPPAEWIPTAERTGVIDEVGCEMLRLATADLRTWLVHDTALSVTVNVSPRQLTGDVLLECVQAVLDAGTPPDHLCLEITESHRVDDSAVDTVRALRALGCKIALDDFGVGYSSLAALARLPIDMVKIDREFTAGLGAPSGRDLVAALITLANRLGLEVIAEGIETTEQREILASVGCRQGQGFLLAGPLSANELARLAGWELTST